MKNIVVALRVLVLMSVLLGLVYPLVMTALAQVVFTHEASGSLIVRDGQTVGSELIAQAFISDRYFHGRPSAIGYDAAGSGASNYGPANRAMWDRIVAQASAIRTREHLPADAAIPADLLTASASGLDPHISVEAARIQVPRIARTRQLPPEMILEMIEKNKHHRLAGIQDTAYVNVLKLNVGLDEVKP